MVLDEASGPQSWQTVTTQTAIRRREEPCVGQHDAFPETAHPYREVSVAGQRIALYLVTLIRLGPP